MAVATIITCTDCGKRRPPTPGRPPKSWTCNACRAAKDMRHAARLQEDADRQREADFLARLKRLADEDWTNDTVADPVLPTAQQVAEDRKRLEPPEEDVELISTAGPKIADDEILDWWELYADGASIDTIARRFGRSRGRIMGELTELGVTIRIEDFSDAQVKLMQSLSNVDYWRREVDYARSMQHIKPIKHPTVVQSQRQRRQDRMASGIWRSAVRKDLRAAGLLMPINQR